MGGIAKHDRLFAGQGFLLLMAFFANHGPAILPTPLCCSSPTADPAFERWVGRATILTDIPMHSRTAVVCR